jgi:hypothetical protein
MHRRGIRENNRRTALGSDVPASDRWVAGQGSGYGQDLGRRIAMLLVNICIPCHNAILWLEALGVYVIFKS